MRIATNASKRSALTHAAVAALAVSAGSSAYAVDEYTYNGNGNVNNTAGVWDSASYWTPVGPTAAGFPNAPGAIANVPANTSTTLAAINPSTFDVSFTVGKINFSAAGQLQQRRIGQAGLNTTITFDSGVVGVPAEININGNFAGVTSVSNVFGFNTKSVLNSDLKIFVDPRNGNPDGSQIVANFLGADSTFSGPGGLIKNGQGTLAFADTAKAYEGATVVNQGRLRFNDAASQAGGLTKTSSVTVNTGGQIAFDVANAAGINSFGSARAVPFDTIVSLAGDGIPVFGGTLRVTTGRITSMNNRVTLASDASINVITSATVTNTKLTLPQTVSGPGGLVKESLNGPGAGTLELTAANSYAGATVVNAGILTFSGAGTLGSTTAALTINSVNVNGGTSTTPATINLNPAATGGSTTIGSLSGTNSGANTAILNNGGGLLTVKQTTAGVVQASLQGAGGLTLASNSTAPLTLDYANTYTGPTTVSGSRLQTTKANSLPGYNTAGKVSVASGATLGVTVGGPLDAQNNPTNWTDAQINTLHTNATFPSGSTLAIDTTPANFTYGFSFTKPINITKLGTNTLTLSAANTHSGGTTVNGGTLLASHPQALGTGTLSVGTGATAQAQANLATAVTVGNISTTGTGKFDLTKNSLVVKNSSLATVDALITQGYNNGDWLGGGLTSSAAATDPSGLTALGFVSNADLGATTFKGVTGLDSDDVLVKYTYYGDSDLNGVVDPDDFNSFLAGFQDNTLPRTWVYGDFDYNNVIDPDDFNLFLAAFQNNGAPLSEIVDMIETSSLSRADQQLLLGAVSAVPEPTSLGLLGLAAGGLLARRRR